MVILFDGVCNLCNGFVQFILKKDRNRVFEFASLQSKYGTALSAHFNLPVGNPETIVLYDGVKIFTESDAVIKIFSSLGGVWKCTGIFYIISRRARNWAYHIVALNRYKIFGKKDSCMFPDWDVKDRFVDNETFIPNQD